MKRIEEWFADFHVAHPDSGLRHAFYAGASYVYAQSIMLSGKDFDEWIEQLHDDLMFQALEISNCEGKLQ